MNTDQSRISNKNEPVPHEQTLSDSLRRLAHAIHSLGPLDYENLSTAADRLLNQEDLGSLPKTERPLPELITSLTAQVEALQNTRREILRVRTEERRAPLPTEPQRIRLDHVTVVTKLSKVEYDIKNRGVSYPVLLDQYRQEGVNWEEIVASHARQQEALHALEKLLPNARFISRDDAGIAALDNSDLVIALGGDDHFKHVSHSVTSGFILGINSDPTTSVGALTSTTVTGLSSLLPSLENGNFLVEEWSRLETSVNGRTLPPACSEIFIGEENSTLTTRARGTLGNQRFFIKGSGLLISTGAGSTGWFRAASQHLFHGEHLWQRTDRHGEFVSREPYGDVESLSHSTLHGRLEPGQAFEIVSSSNHYPIVSVDSLVTVHFPRGHRAVIQISNSPLKVIVPL